MEDHILSQVWKLRTVFDKLNEADAKFYNTSEHLAVEEVIVKLKGRAIFRQYILDKGKSFGIKINKLCDESGYMYDMRAYLGTDSCSTTDEMTATHATVTHLTSRVEGLGHKIIMGNFFWTPRLFDDLDRSKIHFCGTVQPDRKDMPRDSWTKTTETEKG